MQKDHLWLGASAGLAMAGLAMMSFQYHERAYDCCF